MLFHIDAEMILSNENDYVTIDMANCLYFLFTTDDSKKKYIAQMCEN